MTETSITIVNRLGLHARAAASFVELACTFRSKIEIKRGVDTVDGKSILGILALAAPRGTELVLVTEGPDEEEARLALHGLVSSGFGEDA
jgi:phosphocarrier protein